jgi:hypothetical protein
MAETSLTARWQPLADELAQEAHDECLEFERGVDSVWFIEIDSDHDDERSRVNVYSNNPYSGYPTLRPRETAEILRRLRLEGIDDLAIGHYPPLGSEDGGYTQTLLVDAGPDQVERIESVVRVVVEEFTTLRRMAAVCADEDAEESAG